MVNKEEVLREGYGLFDVECNPSSLLSTPPHVVMSPLPRMCHNISPLIVCWSREVLTGADWMLGQTVAIATSSGGTPT